MKINAFVDFLNALEKWHHGEIPIANLCDILGDKTNELGRMLVACGVADFSYKPVEGYSYQAVVNVVLCYLAMRHGVGK